MANDPLPYALKLNECFDDVRGIRTQFNNPSDALFAQLFLKIEGAPLSVFDSILSTIRNPSFNAKDITFKDCGDFCSYVTSSQNGAVCRCGWESNVGLPEVILDSVLDMLGDELRRGWDAARKHFHGLIQLKRMYCYITMALFLNARDYWRSTLLNCAFVHSSWLVRARPALGYYHNYNFASRHSSNRSLMNPWLPSVMISTITYRIYIVFEIT